MTHTEPSAAAVYLMVGSVLFVLTETKLVKEILSGHLYIKSD